MNKMTAPGQPHLEVVLHTPAALKTRQGDGLNALPPCAAARAHDVDRHPACPAGWMRGDDKSSSFFVPVKPDTGMWLDFNSCWQHDHDVAVLVSVQGLNPVDGQSQLQELSLKQYREATGDAPPQNYLATTGTPHGYLWLDGFRNSEGEVRQWVFTKEQMRGIAAQVLGSARVFAIGVAFFLSKEKHPLRTNHDLTWLKMQAMAQAYPMVVEPDYDLTYRPHWRQGILRSTSLGVVESSSITYTCALNAPTCSDMPQTSGFVQAMHVNHVDVPVNPEPEAVDRLELAAGARINQRIYKDEQQLAYWQDQPAGVIYINYCDTDLCERILERGLKGSHRDGFLKGLAVGN